MSQHGITVIDVLDAGACIDGVLEYVDATKVIAGDAVESSLTRGWVQKVQSGNGDGYGDGNGNGNGYGDGNGYGNGYGDGYGYGNGYGYGYGDGDGRLES